MSQVLELIHHIEVNLRSGYNIRQALEVAAKDLPEPIASDVKEPLADLDKGTGMLLALDQWLDRTPDTNLDLMIATIKVQLEVGGNLADKFKLLGQILEKRREI